MADLSQAFGENTLNEPVSETIMRDVRLVSDVMLLQNAVYLLFGVAWVRRGI